MRSKTVTASRVRSPRPAARMLRHRHARVSQIRASFVLLGSFDVRRSLRRAAKQALGPWAHPFCSRPTGCPMP